MKKLSLFLAVALFLMACSKNNKDALERRLTVSSDDTVVFPANASSRIILVKSDVAWIVVSSDTSWCTINPGTGANSDSVSIHLMENIQSIVRMAVITISGTGVASKTIVVKQAAAIPRLLKSTTEESSGNLVELLEYDRQERIVKIQKLEYAGAYSYRQLTYGGSDLVKEVVVNPAGGSIDSTVTFFERTSNQITSNRSSYKHGMVVSTSTSLIILGEKGVIEEVKESQKLTKYVYDEQGSLLKQTLVLKNTETIVSQTLFQYDDHIGCLSQTTTPRWWMILTGYYHYVNNLTEKTIESDGGNLTKKEVVYSYGEQYDLPTSSIVTESYGSEYGESFESIQKLKYTY